MAEIDLSQPVHLIINPHSGYGGQRHLLHEIRAAAREQGVNLVEYTTTSPGDATAYARTLAGWAGGVVVWGGDGTVNEVAGGLAGADVPILPCPVGTENLLAKELRIPTRPRQIIGLLRTGRVVDCDVGQINGRNFLLVAGVGFDGEVVERLTADRTGHISHLSYFWPIWRTFWEHDFPRIRVVADGREVFDERGLVFVGNIARYATGLRIARDAHFNDGLFDLVAFRCHWQAGLLVHAARTLLRRHVAHGSVVFMRFRHLTVESARPVPCQVDGDVGPRTPVEISVGPARVKLVVPHDRYRSAGLA